MDTELKAICKAIQSHRKVRKHFWKIKIMSVNTVTFNIDLAGSAYSGIIQLNKALDSVNINAKKTENIFTQIGNASVRLQGIISVCQTLVGKVSGAIGKMVEAGSENELQKMNMTTLFRGNAEAAEDMFARISEYGKVTIYDKAGLLEAQKTMMSFGITGEQSFATLKQIGDIAMGDSLSCATSRPRISRERWHLLCDCHRSEFFIVGRRTLDNDW